MALAAGSAPSPSPARLASFGELMGQVLHSQLVLLDAYTINDYSVFLPASIEKLTHNQTNRETHKCWNVRTYVRTCIAH